MFIRTFFLRKKVFACYEFINCIAQVHAESNYGFIRLFMIWMIRSFIWRPFTLKLYCRYMGFKRKNFIRENKLFTAINVPTKYKHYSKQNNKISYWKLPRRLGNYELFIIWSEERFLVRATLHRQRSLFLPITTVYVSWRRLLMS